MILLFFFFFLVYIQKEYEIKKIKEGKSKNDLQFKIEDEKFINIFEFLQYDFYKKKQNLQLLYHVTLRHKFYRFKLSRIKSCISLLW